MSIPNSSLQYISIYDSVVGTVDPGVPNGAINRELYKLLQNDLTLSAAVDTFLGAGLNFVGVIAAASLPASPTEGTFYAISVAGTIYSISWLVGDAAIYSNGAWRRLAGGAAYAQQAAASAAAALVSQNAAAASAANALVSELAALAYKNAAAASAASAASYSPKIEVATVVALKALSVASMADGDVALVRCFQYEGDGGGGFFRYVAASTLTDNTSLPITTVAQPNSGSGRWHRLRLVPISSGLLENKYALRDFWKRIRAHLDSLTNTYFGVACYGDSVASHVWSNLVRQLANNFQMAMFSYPANGNNVGGANRVSLSGATYDFEAVGVNQAVMDGTGGFKDFTYLPSGSHVTLGVGGQLTTNNGENSQFSDVRVYLATGPGMTNSATVELRNKDTNTLLLTQTVALSTGGSLGATKVTFTGFDAANKLKVNVIHSGASGMLVHLSTVYLRAFGMIPFNFQCGGSTFTQNNYANSTIFNYLLNDLNVGLIVVQAKEEGWASGTIPTTMTRLAGHTTSSKLVVGSLPDVSGDTVQRQVNAAFRFAALSSDYAFFDGFALFGSYAELTRLGWNGDGTHPDDRASQYAAHMIASELSALFFPFGAPLRTAIDVRNSNYEVQNGLDLLLQDYNGLTARVIRQNGGGNAKGFYARLGSIRFGDYDAVNYAALGAYGTYGVYCFDQAGSDAYFRAKNIELTSTSVASDINADLRFRTAGAGLQFKEGAANSRQGVATLVGGTVTVATNAAVSNARVWLTPQNSGGTPGHVRVSSRVNGTSFTITSSSGTDTSDIAWNITYPAP